jgi:Tfp pilus assembly protein PilO
MKIKSVLSFVTRLSKRERTIFYVTVGVISLVLLDRMVLSPILAKINSLGETIQAKEEAIERSLLIVTQEKRIEGEKNLYSTYLSKPQAEEKTITAFLQDVETLAKKSSIYLTDIKPSGKGAEGEVVQYFVKLSFEAQMEQVFNFFYNVSSFENLIRIEDYQIRPKSEGSSIIVCSISISKTIILE